MSFTIKKEKTALVVIDLQKGIVARDTKPHPSSKVVENAKKLADAFRKNAMQVFLVHVTFSADGKDRLNPTTDNNQPNGTPKPDWADFVPEMGPEPADYIITKRNWGAFYGTDLELQLRRRGFDTIVLLGISTNFGVESTARYAFEMGFDVIFVEDATASFTEEAHKFPFNNIFPRIGRVRKTDEVLEALK